MAVKRLDTKGVEETHFDKKQLIDTFKDVKIWTLAVLYFLLVTPLYSIAFFIPSIVKDMGYTSVVAQLMTVPPYVFAFLFTIGNAYHSDAQHERTFHIIIPSVIASFAYIFQLLLSSVPLRYATCCVMVSCVYGVVPPFLALVTNNASGSTKAASMTAFVVATGNIGGILAPQLYHGHELVLGHVVCASFLLVLAVGLFFLRRVYIRINNQLSLKEGQESEAYVI
jgi:membrane-associated HD superfamily phosphohydrolase